MEIDYLYKKGTGKVNEDQLLLGENIFAVFDGLTSLDKFTDEHGNTGGLIASTTAKKVFSKEDKTLPELAHLANAEIADQMEKQGVDISKKEHAWATSIAAVRFNSKEEIEWLVLSDSVVIAVDKSGGYQLLGGFEDHDEEALRLWKQYAEKGVRNIREEMKGVLLKNRERMNTSYGALNGDRASMDFVRSGVIKTENIAHLILSTDGLFIPTEDPGQESWDLFVQLFQEGGLEKIKEEVEERQKNDPNMRRYPRFKPFDDIAAIAISFD